MVLHNDARHQCCQQSPHQQRFCHQAFHFLLLFSFDGTCEGVRFSNFDSHHFLFRNVNQNKERWPGIQWERGREFTGSISGVDKDRILWKCRVQGLCPTASLDIEESSMSFIIFRAVLLGVLEGAAAAVVRWYSLHWFCLGLGMTCLPQSCFSPVHRGPLRWD